MLLNHCTHFGYFLFLFSDTIGNDPGFCALLLTVISVILIVITLPLSLFFCVKVRLYKLPLNVTLYNFIIINYIQLRLSQACHLFILKTLR